jgi:dihydrofolate synthase/folylpolyglutamate synthase
MPIRTVEEALAALSELTNFERTRPDGPRDFDLNRPRALLERLGSPERKLGARVIQVAGTKGKGSTSRFLDAILRAANLKTGRFLSPHLTNVRERIVVDDEWIPEAEFARHVSTVIDAVDGMTTFFEALLAVACLHFAECGTDAVVLEVGLGGRLDATTAVPSTHTIITPLGLEHTEILGPTLEHIAFEKGSTIRYGVPVWTAVPEHSSPGAVLRSLALRHEAQIHFVSPPSDVVAQPDGLAWGDRLLPVLGAHQAHNAALAVACCADLPREAIEEGLLKAEQPGCCERRGNVIVDSAHTVESIAATLETVHAHFPDSDGGLPKRLVLLLALSTDKDLDAIAGLLSPHVDHAICTQVDDRRGRSAGELAAHPAWQGRAAAVDDLEDALETAQKLANKLAGQAGLVLVTGSVYLAGAARHFC